jgi:hypothetical protein
MAKIPKAATSGGKGKSVGPSYPTAPTGKIGPSVPNDRGGHKVGPTKCTATRGRHIHHSDY